MSMLEDTWTGSLGADPAIMARYGAELRNVYGKRLERAVLYGSRARGDAHEDSDYDVAIFLWNFESFCRESGRLSSIETEILFDTGAVINSFVFDAGGYAERTGFMAEVRRDGRDF